MARLSLDSLDWSIAWLLRHGDNSLFRLPFELEIINERWPQLREEIASFDLSSFKWSSPRRMVFPKGPTSFRRASQLVALDMLVLTGILRECGDKLEALRCPLHEEVVFSWRFDLNGTSLYRKDYGWREFWRSSRETARNERIVAVADIADFYGQLGHDAVLNQLDQAELETDFRTAIRNFLVAFSDDGGRGLPIGPHPVHLLAEVALAPIDNLLLRKGHRFCRYVDDYHFFGSCEAECQGALFDLAVLLSEELHLSLNDSKTDILEAEDFVENASLRLQDPAAATPYEAELLQAIGAVTEGDYDFTSFEKAADSGGDAISRNRIESVLAYYLDKKGYVDYARVGWLLRRLEQVAAPGGIAYVLRNLDRLLPVLGDAASYLAAAGDNYSSGWLDLGGEIIEAMELPIVQKSEYVQMALVALFVSRAELNHFNELARGFEKFKPAAQREALLAAIKAGASDWIYRMRRNASTFDIWLRNAFARAAVSLPDSKRQRCLAALGSQERHPNDLIVDTILRAGASSFPDRRFNEKALGVPSAYSPEAHKEAEVVVSLHGIMTTGAWQKGITGVFQESGFKYRPLDYGFFSVLKLLLPGLRRRRREQFLRDYSEIRRAYPRARIHLVAHSFGTHISAFSMLKYREIVFDRIVFCGAIVPPGFDWGYLISNGQAQCVLNECGRRDVWASLVGWVVADAGPSGVKGFDKECGGRVINAFRSGFRHSDFFYDLNYTERWLPFLNGQEPDALVEPQSIPPNWRFRLFAGALLIALVLFLILI